MNSTQQRLLDLSISDLRLTGTVFFRADLARPWGLTFEQVAGIWLHFVLEGGCWLGVEEREGLQVPPNSILLLPRGVSHWLADAPGSVRLNSSEVTTAWLAGEQVFDGASKALHLMCGAVVSGVSANHPLLRSLPTVIIAPCDSGVLSGAVELLLQIAQSAQDKQDLVLDRLAEILVIETLRHEFGSRDDSSVAFAGVQDSRIAHALELIHGDLAHGWDIAGLAKKVGMSRAAFAARFAEVVGEPPMHHILQWRMARAARLLQTTRHSIYSVATEVGYAGEASFSKAFKRHFGYPPRKIPL